MVCHHADNGAVEPSDVSRISKVGLGGPMDLEKYYQASNFFFRFLDRPNSQVVLKLRIYIIQVLHVNLETVRHLNFFFVLT